MPLSEPTCSCLDANRAPVVIDINHTLDNATAELPVKQMLEDRLCIRESLPVVDGEPSADTVQKLHQSFTATRREVSRLRIVCAAAVVLVVATVIAINQSRVEQLRRQEADQQRSGLFCFNKGNRKQQPLFAKLGNFRLSTSVQRYSVNAMSMDSRIHAPKPARPNNTTRRQG